MFLVSFPNFGGGSMTSRCGGRLASSNLVGKAEVEVMVVRISDFMVTRAGLCCGGSHVSEEIVSNSVNLGPLDVLLCLWDGGEVTAVPSDKDGSASLEMGPATSSGTGARTALPVVGIEGGLPATVFGTIVTELAAVALDVAILDADAVDDATDDCERGVPNCIGGRAGTGGIPLAGRLVTRGPPCF